MKDDQFEMYLTCLRIQVFESVTDCSVNTIVSVLSSLTECNLQHYGESAVMRVGVELSADECVSVMEACGDVLGKLNEGAVFMCFCCICFL